MAKKTTGKTSSSTRRTRKPRTSRSAKANRELSTSSMERDYQDLETERRDYKEIFSDLISNPAVKYVAGGIATALLTRIANNMATRYPEISSFIKENLDNIEGRFSDFNRDLKGDSAPH